MKTFVCDLNITSDKQIVFLPDGIQIKIPNSDFAKVIVSLVQEYETYDLKLFGNQGYAFKYIDDIKQEEIKQYNKNLIQIEYRKEEKK